MFSNLGNVISLNKIILTMSDLENKFIGDYTFPNGRSEQFLNEKEFDSFFYRVIGGYACLQLCRVLC